MNHPRIQGPIRSLPRVEHLRLPETKDLGVFEKVYRFTPFSDDAHERIRGKCPLELAGYEVRKLPMAQLFRGLALQWPASAFQEIVPNV